MIAPITHKIAEKLYSILEVRMYDAMNDSLKSKCFNRIHNKITAGLCHQLHNTIHAHTKFNIKLKKHR